MDRRNFIKLTLASGTAIAGGLYSYNNFFESFPNLGDTYFNIIGSAEYLESKNPSYTDEIKFVEMDLSKLKRKEIPLNFFPHSFNICPNHPRFVTLVSKWGPHACTIDRDKGVILAQEELPKFREFIGHGVYHPKNFEVYISTSITPMIKKGHLLGFISVRDPISLKVKRAFPSYGEDPHQLEFIEGGRVLVVLNQGMKTPFGDTKSNIALIDVKNGKLIKKIEYHDKTQAFAHMAIQGKNIFVATKIKRGLDNTFPKVYVLENYKNLKALEIPEKISKNLKTEFLSIAVDPNNQIVAATNPDSGKVLFWDSQSFAFKKEMLFKEPLGISYSGAGKGFIVNDLKSKTYLISSESLKIRAAYSGTFTGPHSLLIS